VKKIIGFLRLTRPANIVTAVADILAGVAISGYFASGGAHPGPVLWLMLATVGLYGGGVVFNDVFDADLDRVERPERPIPSGLITSQAATILALSLLAVGIAAAFMVSVVSAAIATATAVAAVVYDKWGKHHSILGPLNMGLCRGLNLLLGISIIIGQLNVYWYLGLVPVMYIAAVTMISRGEVHGSSRIVLFVSAALYAVVMATILAIASRSGHGWPTLLFVAAWAGMVFTPLLKAMRTPQGPLIGRAVKAGVIALILMNASWAAAFGVFPVALIIVALLPLSILLARIFAVT
jgi:4-hydroxybenzoate polyprenyltransferase